MSTTVTVKGPLFDGTADNVMSAAVSEAADHVADTVVYDRIQDLLKQSLRHPTGRYQRAINVTRSSAGAVVSDGGMVYGPWLEGVSSRNSRSRFKGYAVFRRTLNDLQSSPEVVHAAEQVIEPAVGRLQ